MKIEFGRCLLREVLRRAGMKQIDLAERSSKTETQISDYINGRKYMSYRTAIEFSIIIGCHAEEFYDWEYQGFKKEE
ncbi:Helix-turn-helix [Oceanobacillus limi]|uniref:Helix-turn-helix n=1 Tax=Oceanobacillus limi TaxID=930131 RepID=A0A1I0EEP8_9BACI|nr:Helix-turn-helix [Oceanobacillus limi]